MMVHYLACSDMGIEVNHIQICIILIFSKVPDSPIVMGQFQVFCGLSMWLTLVPFKKDANVVPSYELAVSITG